MIVFATPTLGYRPIAGKWLSTSAITVTLQYEMVKKKSLKRLKSEPTNGFLVASKRYVCTYRIFR
jgi:hypothetical protein